MPLTIEPWSDEDGNAFAVLRYEDEGVEQVIPLQMIDATSAARFIEQFRRLMDDHGALPREPQG